MKIKKSSMFGYRALSGHVTGLTRVLKKFTTKNRPTRVYTTQLTYIHSQRFFFLLFLSF